MSADPFAAQMPRADTATADALARTLFTPDGFPTVHEPWRQMLATPHWRYQCRLPEGERIALAYRRMQEINARLENPLALATDPVRLAGLHEWIAHADPTCTTVVSIHHNLVLGSIAEADPHPDRELPDVGVFLTTELACGNDAAMLQTTATWNPNDETFTLTTPNNGAQKFMPQSTFTGSPKTGAVAARLHIQGRDHGPMLFLVPLTDCSGRAMPGVRIRPLPERASAPLDHALTSFDHVRVPASALLQGPHGRLRADGAFTSNSASPRAQLLAAIGRVTVGKIAMTGASVGVARASLAIAVRYAHHRIITGRPDPVPIAAHRTHSARLITPLAQTYAANFLHRTTLHRFAAKATHDDSQIEQTIALTKAWITWTAQRIASESRERCGAQGMFQFNGVGGQAAALDSVITAEGDNLPIVVKVAAETLFREIPTPEAVDAHDLRKAPLNDLRQLLTAAESLVARRARERFRSGTGAERGLARWNSAALPAVEAAMIHAVGQAADAFLAAVERCPDRQAQRLLTELCHLFFLTELQPHTAGLLAEGYLSADAVRSLPDAVEERIVALTPHMLTLVSAFRLDGYLAGIPIANPDYLKAFDDEGAHWNRGTPSGSLKAPRWDLAFPLPHPNATSTDHRPRAA